MRPYLRQLTVPTSHDENNAVINLTIITDSSSSWTNAIVDEDS